MPAGRISEDFPLPADSYSEKAIEEAYTGEGSVLIPIYGKKSTHGFEMNFEEGRDYAETVGLEFLDVHLKEEE